MAYGPTPKPEKAKRKPFEVKLSKERIRQLGIELALNVTEGLSARSVSDAEILYWHTLYEQGRTRGAKHGPWADAADLTSHIGTEKVDALRARIVKTIFVEPVWTVEGWGASEARAPFVEEFHQWQQEVEGFQSACARAIHLSLIEPRGVLEVYEDTQRRPVRKTIKAKLQQAPDGSPMVDERFDPLLEMGANGQYVEVEDDQTPFAETEIDSYEVIARGPRHRTIPYRDFLVFPAHATDRADVWGYAKRFFRRVDDLQERVTSGVYDHAAVEALGTDDEHQSEQTLAGDPLGVPPAVDGRAEKELWELLILKDCGDGLRWYVCTLHERTQTLLRFQYDDIGRPRYFSLVPFPRPNSTEGYSFLGHKLITVIEEHTAWRNLDADRGSMQLQMPMKRLVGALWDPDEQPLGAKAVIDVRDMREIEPLVLPDVTGTAVERIQSAERAAERLAGITDAAAGVRPEQTRTLGETNIITEQSFVRMDEAIKHIQETLEDVFQVRHLMWQRALAEMGDDGITAPPSVTQSLQLKGVDVTAHSHSPSSLLGVEARTPDTLGSASLKFTADMLAGTFRGKPRGSVETADKNRMRQDWNQGLQAMGELSKVVPTVAALMQSPGATKALIEQWVRLYHVQDKQAFLGKEAEAAMQQAAAQPAELQKQNEALQKQVQQAQQQLMAAQQHAQQADAKALQLEQKAAAAEQQAKVVQVEAKQAIQQAQDTSELDRAKFGHERQAKETELALKTRAEEKKEAFEREKMIFDRETQIALETMKEQAAQKQAVVTAALAPKDEGEGATPATPTAKTGGRKKRVTIHRDASGSIISADVEEVAEATA